MLATGLAAAERAQASKEHHNGDGLLSPVFNVSRATLAYTFESPPLLVGH